MFAGFAVIAVALGASGCADAGSPATNIEAGKATTAKAPGTKATKKPSAKATKGTKKKPSGSGKTASAPTKNSGKPSATGSTKGGSGSTKPSVPALTERTFVATDLGDVQAVKGSTIELTFGNGQITAKPGCSTLGGPATWENGTLSVGGGGLATTKKACSDALTQQDVWVQALLEAKPKLTLKGRTMTLDDGFNSMTLTEQK